jgi:ankyrin repeat protein
MYPNPQDALPLPSRPNVEQYRKLAKDLVKACRSGGPDAIRTWATRWVESLAALQQEPDALRDRNEVTDRTDQVAQFAREKLALDGEPSRRCALTTAQFVIARAHGFLSWPKFVKHIESLAFEGSDISTFERAAIAVVSGDRATLEPLLREHPDLVRARSTREHRATLLHYVSANGVENFRQVSPKNSAQMAKLLLDAGADVDAEADVYGGACTTLGLVATSAPPFIAGVQREVIDVLLDQGARMDRPGLAGRTNSLVDACLANGQPQAAEYLASRGAPLDFVGAAGLGRVDALERFLDEDGTLNCRVTNAQLARGFSLACAYGRADAVTFLLQRGVDADMELAGHGAGHTGLHVAAYHAHPDVVSILLQHGASIDPIDKTWGTTPLVWALTGWSRKEAREIDRSYEVAKRLVAAGARVTQDLLDWDKARADPKMLAALSGKM